MSTSKNNTQKLLFVINHIDWFWSHRLPLAKGAQEQGWDVHVAVTGASGDEKLVADGFKGHELPAGDEGFGPFTLLKIIWDIHKIIKAEKPDVLHAITLKHAFLGGLAARLHKDVRVVHTLAGLGYLFSAEGMKPKILRALIGPFLKIALKHEGAQLIFQNPDDMELMVKRGFADPARCTLIRGSGVDLTEFPFTPIPDDDEPIVLMPTRLVHEKGVAVFIEAANILRARGAKARYQIAGGISTSNPRAISPEEMDAMLEGSAVEWLGKVSGMPALYKTSAFICYPSYYGEGVPKVLLESAATGRAIITCDHAGCREAVNDDVSGILIPPKDAEATADAIQSLLDSRARMEAMGKESHDLAVRDYDVISVVERTLKVYGRI